MGEPGRTAGLLVYPRMCDEEGVPLPEEQQPYSRAESEGPWLTEQDNPFVATRVPVETEQCIDFLRGLLRSGGMNAGTEEAGGLVLA